MPYDVTEIGEGTFYNCTNLSKVTIPDSANGNCGGILFNYEFKATNVYHAPVAYTRKITLDELEAVLQFHNENNYYNANHNCTTVAIGAWAAAFGTSDGFTARKNSGLYASFDTPTVLKEQILTKKSADTSYKDTMQNILQNWKQFKSFCQSIMSKFLEFL